MVCTFFQVRENDFLFLEMEDEMSSDILWAEDGTVTPSVAHGKTFDKSCIVL